MAALFLSARWKTETGLVASPWTPGFPSKIRLSSNTNTISVPAPRWLAVIKVIQGNAITPAHSDEPYMQKYRKFMETRFHELEHEFKRRLLKTHSHTAERRVYESDKERQQKTERREAYL